MEYKEEDNQLYWSLRNWPSEIAQAEEDNRKSLSHQESKFQDQLEMEKERFQKELKLIQNKFREIKRFNLYESVKEYAMETQNLKEQIEKSLEQVKSFNEREVLFKQSVSEYNDLNELGTDFEPYNKLWELAIDFDLDKQDWLTSPFLKLNFTLLDKKVSHFSRNIILLLKKFEAANLDQAFHVTMRFKEDLDDFNKNIWIIKFLTVEVMLKKMTLWKELFQKCELNPLEPNDDLTFKVCFINHAEECFNGKKRFV